MRYLFSVHIGLPVNADMLLIEGFILNFHSGKLGRLHPFYRKVQYPFHMLNLYIIFIQHCPYLVLCFLTVITQDRVYLLYFTSLMRYTLM